MIEKPVRRSALLDHILPKEGLVGDVKIKDSLVCRSACSDHEMVVFRVARVGRVEKQGQNPGHQESRLWPLQRS